MPPKLRIGSLTYQLFQNILSEADDLLFICSNPQAVFYTLGDVESAKLMLARKEQKLHRMSQKKIRQAFQRLEKRKLIQLRKEGNKILFFLMNDGMELALKQKIQKEKRKLPDGLKCYVSFDIPQHANSVRWALRELLKRSDFKMVHLSLWSTDKDVGKEIAELVKILKAELWIQVFEARSLTQQQKNKK